VDVLREPSFGLVGEAGDQGDGGDVAGPGAAALGECRDGVIGEVAGVVSAARLRAGGHGLPAQAAGLPAPALARARR
jgi:hypothetical protein